MEANPKKTVSVVMCTYNGEKYLCEQMDSILRQTYPIKEIIVQDDCSTDNTVSIIEDYAAKHPNIKLFRNERNLGYNKNFKTVTMRAIGDYIAFSDQDDVWLPEKIERLVDGIGECDICYCNIFRGESFDKAKKQDCKSTMESLLFHTIVGHAMLLRRDFVQAASYWVEKWPYDVALTLEAQIQGRGIAKVSEHMVWHRFHEGEITTHKKEESGRPKKWHPYVYGWKTYRRIQKMSKWKAFYGILYEKTDRKRHPVTKSMLADLLSTKPTALLHLCWLCMRHRKNVYPGNADGLVGYMRGLFFPSIFAYFNEDYFL